MFRAIRTTVAYLALALIMLPILSRPLLADDGPAVAQHQDGERAAPGQLARLDFNRFLLAPASSLSAAPSLASGRAFRDTAPTAQGSKGWSSYSTAKKTWIIVGIVVGVAAIAIAVSNHGDDNGGGGGGY